MDEGVSFGGWGFSEKAALMEVRMALRARYGRRYADRTFTTVLHIEILEESTNPLLPNLYEVVLRLEKGN